MSAQKWEYCTVEWIWNQQSIRCNLPSGDELMQSGSYNKVVEFLTSLGSEVSKGVFTNVSNPFEAGRYHSLAVIEETLPPELVVSARSGDGEVMGLRHTEHRVAGVQFHPESILTPDGEMILSNFLRVATHPTAGWRKSVITNQ